MSTFLQTYRSPLNSSKFKQLYSFPRADRFTNQSYISKAPYYDNKVSSMGKRSTSFGYGTKMSFENKAAVPPPDHYSKQGFFQQQIQRRKGYTFSHESKRNLINQKQTIRIPGPGRYIYQSDHKNFKNVSFSFGSRLDDPLERSKNPLGPGQYKTVEQTNKLGKYLLANHPNSGCGKMNKSRRFSDIESISPGPGKYEDTKVTGLNKSGTYFTSTYKSNKASRFGISPRKHIAEPSIAPGPGSYQRFSDFASYNYK